MKNLYLLFLLCACFSYSQTETKKNKEMTVKVNFRMQTFYPIQFGNTALAKAHKPRIGSSFQFNMLDFNHFKAGFGADFVTYDITDEMVIGNLSTSKYTSGYLIVSYEYPLTPKLYLNPNISYGSSSLELGSRGSRFGKQHGKEFRIGGMADYKIGNGIFISAGINYINNRFNVETSPEYVDFFSKANQIQCNFGIRFGN